MTIRLKQRTDLQSQRPSYIETPVKESLMSNDRIPTSTIGIVAKVLKDQYSCTELQNLFDIASAPDNVSWNNKSNLISNKLKAINGTHERPLNSLGIFIRDFMDNDKSHWSDGFKENINAERQNISRSLATNGYFYSAGGIISKGGITPALSLMEQVRKDSLSAIQKELERALNFTESDPQTALLCASNALEATLKVFLERRKVQFNPQKDTLKPLWEKFVTTQGLQPKSFENQYHKEVASGLYKIVSGIMSLRNRDSSAHGRTNSELEENSIRPRHARLVINAVAALAGYVLECSTEQ